MKGSVYAHPPDRETTELLGHTVLSVDGRLVAIPPGGLQVGEGTPTFMLLVESVIDMGNHLQVFGTIDGTRADVRLPSGAAVPQAGSALKVHAVSHAALRLGS
jgi:hypothetical protein